MEISFTNLPDKNHPEFRNIIDPPRRSSALGPSYKPPNLSSDDRPQNQAETKRHAPYVSFGDQGTTATASAFGSVMRVSRYIDREDFSSKVLGLEYSDGMEAYYVYWRASQFLQEAQVHMYGFGIRMPDTSEAPQESPTLTFLRDRWPLITYRMNGFQVQVRLSCWKNTVVQRVTITNETTSTGDLNLILDPNFLMQDLDYTEKRTDLKTRYKKGPHGHGIIVMEDRPDPHTDNKDQEQDPQKDREPDQERVCVLIGLFENGVSQELEPKYEEDPESIAPLPIERKLKRFNSIEFTAAIKLQYTKMTSDWKDFILTSADLDLVFDGGSSSVADLGWPFSMDTGLSWHLRRNLEHILSVCSLPINPDAVENDSLSASPDADDQGPQITLNTPESETYVLHGTVSDKSTVRDIGPVALTCGDFGDHRVSVSGSYFAFTFMLAMYQRLYHHADSTSICERIHEICRGHLKWIARLDASQAFSSNLWVNGEVIRQTEETDMPADSPANMPSHILKATEYLKIFKQRADLIFVCSWLDSFIFEWFKQIYKTQNRLTPTWAHLADSSDIPVYRLSDHVWIWKALRDIEELIKKVDEEHRSMPHDTLGKFLHVKSHLLSRRARRTSSTVTLNFTAEDLRKQNLRRFTLENDILRKRMLSVTRTARETRFLFHSRDTILYYGEEWGFFDGDQQPLWAHLVDAQIQHEEAGNDEVLWDNPLRYGLAVIMSYSGSKLDRNFKPQDMQLHAKQVIMNSSSENGLFPGQLDEFTKEPLLFDSELFRDFYFHCGFEIPYILLRTARKFETKHSFPGKLGDDYLEKGKEGSSPGAQAKQQESASRTANPQLSTKKSNERHPVVLDGAEIPLDGVVNVQSDGRAVVVQRTLKRQNPYGRLVDLSNIVEVPEEWLYKYPDFLDFQPPQDMTEVKSIIKDAPSSLEEKPENVEKQLLDREYDNDNYTIIVDIRKGRKQRKWTVDEKSNRKTYYEYGAIWRRLQEKRTTQEAKKRFLYLSSVDYIRARICYLASPELERVHIAQFFDRHAKSEAHLYDDTTVVSNSWVTEVHFRFYQVEEHEIPMRKSTIIRQLKSQRCDVLGQNAFFVNAMVGFRIVGDFFDRYWTCHLIESFADPTKHAFDTDVLENGTHWQQRKVLELMLFNRMLRKVCESADPILRTIERGPTEKSDAGEKYFSKDSFEDRGPENLRECFQVLVILKNNFASLQGIIDQWVNRESSQGRERPRWTRSDEQKYRKSIKQNLAILESQVRDLKTKEARIEFLITLVTGAQDAIRAKKSLTEAENITLFTYVTVFFLPVGLAVSIFSMGDIPERRVITPMAITAVVALLITVGVLYFVLHHMVRGTLRRIWDLFRYARPKKSRASSGPEKDAGKMKPEDKKSKSKASNIQNLLHRLREQPKSEGVQGDLEGGQVESSPRTSLSSTDS